MSESATKDQLVAELATKDQLIADLQAKIELLESMVTNDQLTGALTRAGFNKAVERRVLRWDHLGYEGVIGVLYLDANNFKDVNDRFGHNEGDRTLKSLVNLLHENTRPGDLVARAGGDEFWIVLQTKNLDDLNKVLMRINRNVRVQVHDEIVNFSIGVVSYNAGEGIESALERAEALMYRAKNSDRVDMLVSLR